MQSLFRSQACFELLDLLAHHPEKSFYLNELAKSLKKDAGNLSRELGRLQEDGVVELRLEQDKKYYSLNKQNPLAADLADLLRKHRHTNTKEKFDAKWMMAEEIPNACPFFLKIPLDCSVNGLGKTSGQSYKKVVGIYRGYHLHFYFDDQDAYDIAERVVNRFESEPMFMDETNARIIKSSDDLREFSYLLPGEGLHAVSDQQLWDWYKKHEEVHAVYYQWGMLPVVADMYHNNLTERGKQILRRIGVEEKFVNEHLALLTQPTKPSVLKQEQDAFRGIGIKVQQDPAQAALLRELFRKFKEEDVKQFGLHTHSPTYEKKFEAVVRDIISQIRPDILKDLQDHYQTYFYSKFLFTEEQGVHTFDYYLKELVRLVNGDRDLAQTAREEEEDLQQTLHQQTELIAKLELDEQTRQFFAAWGDFMVTKIYRRYVQIFALYKMTPILEEIGRRLGLTLKQTRFLLPQEIEAGLLSRKMPERAEVQARSEFSVYYADGGESKYYTGKLAQDLAKLIQQERFDQVTEIKGQCGCRGSAAGIVRIVNVPSDIAKVKEGDILVSICTQPDLLPAMKKAAAFITDQGGVTSHAAIVAREMNTPCVIGTKIATKVLKDGMRVEVDANKGIVRIL